MAAYRRVKVLPRPFMTVGGESYEGHFHGFSTAYEMENGHVAQFPVALVEHGETGMMDYIPAQYIQFLYNPATHRLYKE